MIGVLTQPLTDA